MDSTRRGWMYEDDNSFVDFLNLTIHHNAASGTKILEIRDPRKISIFCITLCLFAILDKKNSPTFGDARLFFFRMLAQS